MNIRNKNNSMASSNKKRIFYICSYGGCGSKMLGEYLKSISGVTSRHIHTREPPINLTNVKGIYMKPPELNDSNIANITVIYIYRANPINSIYSRFNNKNHLKNIQAPCSHTITISEVAKSGTDLYQMSQFYSNYTYPPKKPRNYDIHCVKYDDFFDNLEEFNKHFGLPETSSITKNKKPIRKETDRSKQMIPEDVNKLKEIYKSLTEDMASKPFIHVVPAGCCSQNDICEAD